MSIKEVGFKIETRRKENNFTQISLAEKLNLSRSYIRKIENGKIYPSLKTLEKISKVLDCSVEYFFDYLVSL